MTAADEEIRNAVAEVWAAAERAEDVIARHCPGTHRYIQHRDRNAPWCPACRYTEAGLKIPRRTP